MNTLTTSSESSTTVSVLMDKLAQACSQLVDALVMTFDKISEHGVKTIQGVVSGIKSLYVDVIIVQLNQIATLLRELKQSKEYSEGDHTQKLIQFQKNELMNRLSTHTFFRENFARRVNEIFN